MYRSVNSLTMSNAGHKCGYVALHVCLECVHVSLELGSRRDVDAVMDLEINEAITLECMELVPDLARVAESADAEFRGDMGVPSQFDVQAMVRASEAEGLGSEVWRTLVEVRGGVEGRMELPECSEFGPVGGNSHEFNPPPSVCPL